MRATKAFYAFASLCLGLMTVAVGGTRDLAILTGWDVNVTAVAGVLLSLGVAATFLVSALLNGRSVEQMFYTTLVRRGNPRRIYEAQRAGFIERTVSTRHLRREQAEAIVDALEQEAAEYNREPGSPDYWREAERRAGL